jgi:hypothetical protein
VLPEYANWADDRVYVRTPSGEVLRLPLSWTSLAPADPFVIVAAGRAHFRVEDLRGLVVIVEALRPQAARRRKTKVSEGRV